MSWDPDNTIWIPNVTHISYKSANSYTRTYNYFCGYGYIFTSGFLSSASYGGYVISSNSNIFEKAEFGIYKEIGYLTISNIKEN